MPYQANLKCPINKPRVKDLRPAQLFNLVVKARIAFGLLVNTHAPDRPQRMVRYTQASIAQDFKGGGGVMDFARALQAGMEPSELPPIRVFTRNGSLYSLGHRRLFAGQMADVSLPYQMATPREIITQSWKFRSTNGGAGIRKRGVGYFSWFEGR